MEEMVKSDGMDGIDVKSMKRAEVVAMLTESFEISENVIKVNCNVLLCVFYCMCCTHNVCFYVRKTEK